MPEETLPHHIREALREASSLAAAGEEETSILRMHALVDEAPEDPVAWFELAGFLDSLGREETAVEPYERADRLGLPDELRPQWTLQYGSTLRLVGRLDESIRILDEGRARYPAYPAIDLMLALAMLDAGRAPDASTTAIRARLKPDPDGSVERYRRALEWYVDDAERRMARGDDAPA